MYKVKFNTEKFKSKYHKDWEYQLMNDFAVVINGKEFFCKTDLDLENRFLFIFNKCYSIKNSDLEKVWEEYEKDENNFFKLFDDRYGTQRLRYGMYGVAQGYINFDEILEKLKEKGKFTIPFNDFYDIRQGNFFKGCFVEITICDDNVEIPKSEIHIWMGENYPNRKSLLITLEATERALKNKISIIHTTQPNVCSTRWLLEGYRIFVHMLDGKTTELKLGQNDNTLREIKVSSHLEHLLLSGCFGKATIQSDED